MTRFIRAFAAGFAGIMLTTPAVWADDDADEDEDEVIEATVSGKRPPPIKGRDIDARDGLQGAVIAPVVEDAGDRPYTMAAYRGAKVLNMDVQFVADCINAINLLYLRDYKGAKDRFAELGRIYPDSGLEPVGQVLVWQAMMLENFDFRYESQYNNAFKRARQQLEVALQMPGNDAWENFLLAGMLGIDAIHAMRHEEYITALTDGYEALKSVNRCKELAPEFKDPFLGDGLYNYWRTVITMNTKGLPDFGDHRAKGIAQMEEVERDGIFLVPPATLALVFTWIEEGEMKKALDTAMVNYRKYPDNVINDLVLGRVYMYSRRYDKSAEIFEHVLRVSPENQRVHYYKTLLYLRKKDLDSAEASINRYLAFTDLGDEFRAGAHYQKGVIYYRRKDFDTAEAEFKKAWKLGKLKRAKSKLDMLKERESG